MLKVVLRATPSRRVLSGAIAPLALLLATSTPAWGQSIGFDFGGRTDAGVSGGHAPQILGAGEVAGVTLANGGFNFAQSNWNNSTVGSSVTGATNQSADSGNKQNLVDSTGAVTAVDVTWTSNESWNSGRYDVATADRKLMRGYINQTNNTPITVGFTEIPFALYDVVFYVDGDSGGAVRPGTYSLSSNTVTTPVVQSITDNTDFGNGSNNNLYRRAIGNTNQAGNFLLFEGFTGSSLNLSLLATAGDFRNGLAAVQIINRFVAAGVLTWTGTVDGSWDIAATPNWSGSGDGKYTDGQQVLFDETGANKNVTVAAGGVTPQTITVNSVSNYTIGGDPIKGAQTPLIKDGTSTLTLNGLNTFAGSATIKAGKIVGATVGGIGTAGALGSGGSLTLGDLANNTSGTFEHTGASETATRSVTVAGPGGAINIPSGATTLTLTGSLGGTGKFTKRGNGTLVFNSTTGGTTGNLDVRSGTLSVASLGVGAAGSTLDLASATTFAAFEYTGRAHVNDLRSVTVGGGLGWVVVGNANARYQVGSLTFTAGDLMVAGSGRFAVKGIANLAQLPTIGSNATLALQNESTATPNIIPAGPITISGGGTLEVAPNALGGNTAPITLSGGTLRLGNEALDLAVYENQGPNDDTSRFAGTYGNVVSYFSGLTPNATGRTDTGGRTSLDFSNNNFSDQGSPFSPLAGGADNIQALITGKLLTTTPGEYTFFTNSDDGSALFINGQRIVNNNNFQGNTERSGQITLGPGLHDIAVYYYEGILGAGLRVDYTAPGGPREPIPNAVLFGGTYNEPGRAINVTADSALESGGKVTLGNLSLAGGTNLTLNGNFAFPGTSLGGVSQQVIVRNRLSSVNLGSVTAGANSIINKSGAGALVISAGVPSDLTINVNSGLLVGQGSTDHLAATAYSLGDGAGLGFSAAADATFTRTISTTDSYRLEAGRFGAAPAVANLTVASTSGSAFTVAGGKTLTLASTSGDQTLTLAPSLSGPGSIVAEQGNINAQQNVTTTAGFTVQVARFNVTGNVAADAIAITGTYEGIIPTRLEEQGKLTVGGATNATSITVAGGFTAAGSVTATGALTLNSGTVVLNGPSTFGSVAVGAGTLNINGATSSGPIAFTGGRGNFNAAVSGPSLTLSGASVVNMAQVATIAATTVNQGSTLEYNSSAVGAGQSVTGAIEVKDGATLRATQGITDLTTATVTTVPLNSVAQNIILGLEYNQINFGFNDAAVINTRIASGAGGASNSAILRANNGPDGLGKINFGPRYGADGKFSEFYGATVPDQFTNIFTASFTPAANGDYQFGFGINDDGAAIFLDLNRDGAFQGSERIFNQDNCCGDEDPLGGGRVSGNLPLTAGLDYKYALVLQDTGGGSSISGFYAFNGGPRTLVGAGDAQFTTLVEGGTLVQVDAGAELRLATFNGARTLTLAGPGAVLRVAGGGAGTVGTIAASGGAAASVLDLGATVNARQLNITGAGTVTKQGAGTLTADGQSFDPDTLFEVLAGTAVLKGNVVVAKTGGAAVRNGATLIVNGGIAGSATVDAGGSLRGGTVNVAGLLGSGTVAGTLAPGALDLAGRLTFSGPVSLLSGSTELISITNAVDYSRVTSLSDLTIGTNVQLTLALNPGSSITMGDKFFINVVGDAFALTGTFAGLPNAGLFTASGQDFQIWYTGNATTASLFGGNDILLVAVPEPTTALALLSGLGMLLATRRPRRK